MGADSDYLKKDFWRKPWFSWDRALAELTRGELSWMHFSFPMGPQEYGMKLVHPSHNSALR